MACPFCFEKTLSLRGMCYFLVPNKKVTKEVGLGSEGSAAGGRRSDPSEWQRSASREPASSGKADAGHRNRATGDPAKANGLCGERRSQGTGGIFRLREMEHCALCFDENQEVGQRWDDKREKV